MAKLDDVLVREPVFSSLVRRNPRLIPFIQPFIIFLVIREVYLQMLRISRIRLVGLMQLILGRIKDVIVGPMSIRAQITKGFSARFIGSSLPTHTISADGRERVTIPALAD